ncbi:MAG: hypothetical protein JWM90_341 [Thermoleophilia bacterium]|nr:hypothetical protein [Thermoleophilia bacterium]
MPRLDRSIAAALVIETCLGDTFVKLRTCLAFVMIAALIATGCGSDDKSEKSEKKAASSPADKVLASKQTAVKRAEKDFKKDDKNVDACRNLAMSYVALASPESTGDLKKAPKQPKDREKNLKKSTDTLKSCTKIAPKDRNVQQMLASTLMATGKYKDAAPILKNLAGTATGQERANAYYAWGLAASNAQDLPSAIKAWQTFVELSPATDQRVPQVRQSIKALQAAQKTAAAAPAAATKTEVGDKDAAAKDEDAKSDDGAEGDDN